MASKAYKIAVFEQGQGEPVVLLHGSISTHRYWTKEIEALEGKCKTYAVDLLGFGASPKPISADYDFEQHSNSILKTLEQAGVKTPFTLVGHSLGALLALYIAKHHPDKVNKLILTGMSLSGTGSRF